jgi:hypothetical protein
LLAGWCLMLQNKTKFSKKKEKIANIVLFFWLRRHHLLPYIFFCNLSP